MTESDLHEMIAVLKLIDERWALVDDDPETDYMVLVNESRDEFEDLYPKNTFVKEMEKGGLIEDRDKFRSAERRTSSHYEGNSITGEWVAITKPAPIVYFYEITKKGRTLLQKEAF